MKKIVLAVIVLFVFVAGCAGYGIVLRPDIYVSGDLGPPRYGYYGGYYGPFWEYLPLTIVNGSKHELKIIRDGIGKGTVLPGQHLRLLIKNYYNENRQVSMAAVAYSGGRFVGTATRSFQFYGSTYSRQSEIWQITDWDIRR